VLGTKVTKKTFRGVVEGKIREQRSHSAELPQPQEQEQEETPSKNTDFVGREEAIAHLDNLVNEGAKVILIQGEGGIGKTTLAEEWFERQGLKNFLELDVGTTRQTIYPAEDWVKQTLRSYFDENPEQNFRAMMEQLKHKLQTKRIGLLINNLEVALSRASSLNQMRTI
jgi:shikimate 5-dehydrogenase